MLTSFVTGCKPVNSYGSPDFYLQAGHVSTSTNFLWFHPDSMSINFLWSHPDISWSLINIPHDLINIWVTRKHSYHVLSTMNCKRPHNIHISFSLGYCSVAKLYSTLCNPMDYCMPGFCILHHLLESAQTHVHWVGDAIQPSHTLSIPSPPALNLS